jgi:chromosome segregation ATPase
MSSSSNTSNGSTNNTAPPPNQQSRQPPQGGNNGHRKSSSLNRGWFEGTMEVISGMAPRPVTPSQNPNIRSASAPNSPARGLGIGLFGGGGRTSPHHHFPPHIDRTNSGGSSGGGGFALPNFPINRLPSQDSLDRSIHNESGHGKSTAQIIRDLKHANSALSAKMASLEKRQMNELAQVEATSSSKRQELEQISAKQKMKLMQYEQYKAAAESKMKEQDSDLSKVKEESAFQRHSISDLKNQLFQLQQELDERDEDDENRLDEGSNDTDDPDNNDLRRPYSDDGRNLPLHPCYARVNSGLVIAPTSSSMSTDDLQQMALDNEELVKEIQELQDQLMEYQGYDKKLKDLQLQLESAQKTSNGNEVGIPSRPTTPTHSHLKNLPDRERPPLAPSKSRDQDETMTTTTSDLYRKQLQDTKEELDAKTLKLYQHESSVRDLEAEKVYLVEAHSQRIRELEDKFAVLEEQSKEREFSLRKELSSLSHQEIETIETRIREEQQENIVELDEQLEQYAEKLAEVAATLAESRQQAKNQEQYRKDEAEDLRMIQDAHEAEIVRLEKELDEATNELELRDEELDEFKQKYLSSSQQEKEDEKKFEERDTDGQVTITDNNETRSAKVLTNTISFSKENSNKKLDSDLEEQLYNSDDAVNKLELQLKSLRKEHNEAVVKLEMENVKLMNDLETARKTEVSLNMDNDSPDLHRYWEEKTSKTKELGSLKNEIENMRQRLYESSEAGKLAEKKARDSEIEVQKYLLDNSVSNDQFEELKLAKIKAVESDEEISRLKVKIEDFDFMLVENKTVKKELQEAQTSLVALDDDKQAMHNKLNELVCSLQEEKDIQSAMTTQLESQELELAELQKIRSLVKPLEAEKYCLQKELYKLKEHHDLRISDEFLDVVTPITPNEVVDIKQNLMLQIADLKEEESLIKSKLKDRDTTIATLLRSSIILEKKIESLHIEVDEARAKCGKAFDELHEMRSTQVSWNEEYSKANEEIKYLKYQLKIAKADAKRWKHAMKEDGTSSGEYRYQISMLQKSNEVFAETIHERDQAIENLVNQSIGQESHVRDLKIRISSLMKEIESVRMNYGRNNEGKLRAEIERLQEESEIFAGQIIEQDEEFKRMQRVLNKREDQIGLIKKEIEGINDQNNFSDNSILKRDRQIFELQKKIESLESQRSRKAHIVDPVEMKNLRAECDEMQEAAESNRIEIRDLRQQLWEAKAAGGSASDLRVQLDQARRELNEYERNIAPENLFNKVNGLPTNLDKHLTRIKDLEETLARKTATETKLYDLQIEIEGRETVIKELREQLSNDTNNDKHDKMEDIENLNEKESEFKVKKIELESQLRSNIDELENVNKKLNVSQSEICNLNELLQSKADKMVTLFEQISLSQNQISNMKRIERSSVISQLNGENLLQSDETGALEYVKATMECIKSLNEQCNDLENEAINLREKNEEKTKLIAQLEDKARILTRNADIVEQNLQATTKTILDLEQQLEANKIGLKEAGSLKQKLRDELADSQARLGALETELLGAITETSSNEELSRKNQSLVQENASFAQKNESLVQENSSFGKINDNLIEESETLTKDNQILCAELKTLREQKSKSDLKFKSLIAQKQLVDEENKSISLESDELNEKVVLLTEKIQSLGKCNNTLQRDVEVLTKKVENSQLEDPKHLTADHDALRQRMNYLAKANDSLTDENGFLLKKNKELTDTIQNLKEKNQSLVEMGEDMEESIESLKADIENLSQRTSEFEELKIQVNESEVQRKLSEKTIIENYEKQVQSLSASKDAEIDSLRKTLAESREKSSENIGEVIEQLKGMEKENICLRDELELEMQAKDQQIFALEHTLHAQEQIVDTMRSEMDQIQSGMEHATKARRHEVEEMQQEVMQVEGKAMKQEREIVALKMQLEERKLEHKADVVKLKDALAKAIEQDSPLKQTISELQNNDRMLEVRERLEQLKARNTDLQEENLNLGGRLERAAIQISAFEVEKERAEEIEGENMKLRNQLTEYEQILSRTTKPAKNTSFNHTSKIGQPEIDVMKKAREKKKKKFGLFKRRNVDECISEGKEEEEC